MKEINKPILLSSTVLAATGGGAAMAQDASNFQGFYGGLTFGFNGSEDLGPEGNEDYTTIESGSNIGVFAGYTHAFGRFTVGGEIHYTTGDLEFETDPSASDSVDYGADELIDLKAKVGTVFNSNIHAYGFVGYSQMDVSENADYLEAEHFSPSGFNYGLGVEYQVMDRVNLGLEYIQRDFSNDTEGDYLDVRGLSTVSLRVGFQF